MVSTSTDWIVRLQAFSPAIELPIAPLLPEPLSGMLLQGQATFGKVGAISLYQGT